MKKIKKAIVGALSCVFLSSMTVMAEEPKVYSVSDFAMNTVVAETLYTTGEDCTGEIAKLLRMIEETYLSWTVETSEIYKINTSNELEIELSERTAKYLQSLIELSEASEGAVDPTIGEIIREWNIDGENPHIPEEEVLKALLEKTGTDKILLDGNKLTMEDGTTLDLGAVGKGIGCDEVFHYLQDKDEVSGMILNLGGSSVMSYGKKPDGSSWKVGVTDPRDSEGEYLGVIALEENEFLSTSGDYEKFFIEDNVRYHHIFDPETGYPVWNGLSAVTVVCDSGVIADGLSTACFVLGIEKSEKLLEQYQADALFVTEDGNVYVSEGMKERFTLLKDSYELQTAY